MRYNLQVGFKSKNGQVEIVAEDSLCYLVKNNSRNGNSIRTISKRILEEYVEYFENHLSNSAQDAREELSGKSAIDKFEYGYTSTIAVMAKMVLGEELRNEDRIQISKANAEITRSHGNLPLQVIYFGAPGTGKSHRIKQECKEHEHYRITFHPDTDYASFVGSYKPITISEKVYHTVLTSLGAETIEATVNGEPISTNKITYKYVYQAFLNAYIAAWREQQNEEPKPVFLVIEEINRGNCAQIFGDIFQLLDRNDAGYSDYPIVTDNDLRKELENEFADLSVANADAINSLFEEGDVVRKVINGSRLLLPNNLYIWATMNTSDQSLFPIDSAFKRRWEWKYVKIADSGKNYIISVNGNEYDWWSFVSKINEIIGNEIEQEDKKLGYFFAKTAKDADGRYIISADKFLSKVIFFLYNDVFKDFGFEYDFFKDKEGNIMLFADYFNEYGDTDEEKVEQLLINLGVDANDSDVMGDNDLALPQNGATDSNPKDNSKYSINGSGRYNKRTTVREALQLYINQNPDLTATEIIDNWSDLKGLYTNNFIESETAYLVRTKNNDSQRRRSWPVDMADGSKLYIKNGWGRGMIDDFISKINSKDWGIHIDKVSE